MTLVGAGGVAVLGACQDSEPTSPAACLNFGTVSVVTEVRDGEGRASAVGATVTLSKPGYTARGKGYGDSLRVVAGENEGGTFTVLVTKPWHVERRLDGVRVREDRCGHALTETVQVELVRVPGAPPLRQVVVPAGPWGFGACGYRDSISARVEADDTVSGEVRWVSRDTTVVSITPGGTFTTRCRPGRRQGSTFVVAMAVADTLVRDSLVMEVQDFSVP